MQAQKLRQEASTPTIKSLSPRPETKISYLRSPRLPTIGASQKVPKKFLNDKSDSPVNILGSRTGTSKVKDFPSPREKANLIKTRFTLDEIPPLKISGSQSIIEESLIEPTLSSFKGENEFFKSRLDVSTKKNKFYQNFLVSIEKNLKAEPALEILYQAASLNDWKNSDEQENFILQGMIEALVSFKVEVGKLQESVKRKENNERILNKDRKDELALINSENSSLKGLIQELTRKIDKLRVSKAKAKQMILQAKSDSQEASERNETALKDLKLDLHEKTQECDQLKDLLIRNETVKKRLGDNIKELETEIVRNRNDYIKVENQYELLKRRHQNLIEQLSVVEEKAKKYESTVERLENQSLSLNTLEIKISEDTDVIKKLQKTLNSLEHTFEMHRAKWRRKEESYQKSIQELLLQVENERVNAEKQVNETIKLKKTLSFRDSEESLSGFTRDEITRYMNRIQQAETESTNNAIEVEKLKKTLDYYKDLLKNKNEIICQLETYSANVKAEHVKEYETETKDYELRDALILVKAHLMCQNCSVAKSTYLVHPCGNYICNDCRPQHNLCPVCMEKYSNCTPCSLFESIDNLSQKLQKVLL